MPGKLEGYRLASGLLPARNRLLPLYGAGFENLGLGGKPVEAPLPVYGPDELLVRHDACGLCFSDIKVIKLGGEHPRIAPRDLQAHPVIVGHELSLTVVGVGGALQERYRVGQRFIIQPDIFYQGRSIAYGYVILGGLAQYGVVGKEILNGDGGCYLLPMADQTGYAEAALTEPWACVNAAYHLNYRTGLQPEGTAWFIGAPGVEDARFMMSRGFIESDHPGRILLSDVPAGLSDWLKQRAELLGITVIERNGLGVNDFIPFQKELGLNGLDDVVVLGPAQGNLIGVGGALLKKHGILNLTSLLSLPEPAPVDVGRLHYDYITIVGCMERDISAAYLPIRSNLKEGGALWVLGASGPMGQMHVQRALEIPPFPRTIVATNLRSARIQEISARFSQAAREKGIELVCLTKDALGPQKFQDRLVELTGGAGFDDIMALAPDVNAIQEAAAYLAPGGVMNLFVGLARGTTIPLDLNPVLDGRQERLIGATGSSIQDLRDMLDLTERGKLVTNRSVAAVSGLDGAVDGLKALQEGRFSGKVVVYPNISGLGLTSLEDLHQSLPEVSARLGAGQTWTNAAEQELLEELL